MQVNFFEALTVYSTIYFNEESIIPNHLLKN